MNCFEFLKDGQLTKDNDALGAETSIHALTRNAFLNEKMTQPNSSPKTITDFNSWLKMQIQARSVDALSVGIATCVACSKSKSGEYIIDYQGHQLRYSPEKTYAFLNFILD